MKERGKKTFVQFRFLLLLLLLFFGLFFYCSSDHLKRNKVEFEVSQETIHYFLAVMRKKLCEIKR
jgi:hypothetical protein